MHIEYTEIDEMFDELGGAPRTWWPLVEDEAYQLVAEFAELKELRFE